MPFLCLGIGLLIGIKILSATVIKMVDRVVNIALIVLMLTIGMKIGINDEIMSNLGKIGFNCAVISLSGITTSVLFVLILEKTVLPLGAIKEKLNVRHLDINSEIELTEEKETRTSPLIWIMPVSIILGVLVGNGLLVKSQGYLLGYLLMGSLVLLYTGVGVSLGMNRKVFSYLKIVGFKVIYLSVAILLGSFVGGLFAGVILGMPLNYAIMSSGGMSYYSITGAYMTQVYGIEAGTYGFVVNVFREFFTVLLLPLLVKISKGSPIASGAAGNMDTMLVPVTKFVGPELGLVALITGIVLTFSVPILLPILYFVL